MKKGIWFWEEPTYIRVGYPWYLAQSHDDYFTFVSFWPEER